jgi:hypothetical protein
MPCGSISASRPLMRNTGRTVCTGRSRNYAYYEQYTGAAKL